jgi:hypothetical protein
LPLAAMVVVETAHRECFGKGINRIHVRESPIHAIIVRLTLGLDA